MEILGIIGTIFILIAFIMNGEFKIRIFDLVGALLFVIYGITIKSFSTILLNSILIIIQLCKLISLRRKNNEN